MAKRKAVAMPEPPEPPKNIPLTLDTLFSGDAVAHVREALKATGEFQGKHRTVRVVTRPIPGSEDVEVMSLAAVSRDPGRSEDYIDTIQDFEPTGKSQRLKVEMYRRIYLNEGLVNNAVNKIAAILSGGGSFKVRKAKKGKTRKDGGPAAVLQEILYQWTRRVNSSAEDSVVTGSRGLKAINHQAVRQALVEGSWVGRTIWASVDLPTIGRVDLPMAVHSLSTANLEPVKEIVGTGLELFRWVPPEALVKEIRRPSSKEVGDLIKKFIPKDILGPLKKDGKVLLDPALLLHVKNRGVDSEAFGESFIQPALTAIAYRRSIEQLDLVTIQSLINRITVVMVGSSDPKSPYSDKDVSAARHSLMNSFFEETAPNMVIVWQGDDVKIETIGAHADILGLDERHKIADTKVKLSLGVPDALLSGSTPDGKAAGWAAVIGAGAMLEELQNRFSQIWTTLGERIAIENNYTDIDLVYEFDHSLIIDRTEEINQALAAYKTGVIGIRTTLERMGLDPDGEYGRRLLEGGHADASLWQEVFMPPEGLQGQADGAAGGGRPTDGETGKTTRERVPKPSPDENK
jgi:hypothetical protein